MNLLGKVLRRIIASSSTDSKHKLRQDSQQLISEIVSQNLTFLSEQRLSSIATTCQNVEYRNLPGVMIEAGCALGGSAILIANAKRIKRHLYIYDMFGMIPPPTAEDGPDVQERYKIIKDGRAKGLGGNPYYGYEKNLIETVRLNLTRFNIEPKRQNIELIKGLLQETMNLNAPIAFAHIDVDWYDPVKVSLERIVPKLVIGGSVILDDYHDWSGCRKATDEFFEGMSDEFVMDDTQGSMKVTKIR